MAKQYFEMECEGCGTVTLAPADGSPEAWHWGHTDNCRYVVIKCLSIEDIEAKINQLGE